MAERASRCASTRASPRSGGSGLDCDKLRATAMTDPVEPLVADLLEWIGRTDGRPYAEVMEAWRRALACRCGKRRTRAGSSTAVTVSANPRWSRCPRAAGHGSRSAEREPALKIATFNVNGVNGRLPRL